MQNFSPIIIRRGHPDDADALERLAALDSSGAPAEPVLLAEANGAVRAAISLHDGALVADPFFDTGAIKPLLRMRAAQLRGDGTRGRRRPRLAWGLPAPLRRVSHS